MTKLSCRDVGKSLLAIACISQRQIHHQRNPAWITAPKAAPLEPKAKLPHLAGSSTKDAPPPATVTACSFGKGPEIPVTFLACVFP